MRPEHEADAAAPGGFLGGMDPRAKGLVVLASSVFAFVPAGPLTAAVHATLLVLLCLLGLGPRGLLRPLRALAPLLALLVILTPLLRRGGSTLVTIAGRPWLTEVGLEETFRFFCRLIALTLAFYVYYRTTQMHTALAAARWFGVPDAVALTLAVAYRLIPSVAALYRGVQDAHSLRRPPPGAEGRGIAAAVRRAAPVAGAVLVHSVKNIPVLAMALETRGVGRRNRRSSYCVLPPLGRMIAHLGLGLAVLALPHLALALV